MHMKAMIKKISASLLQYTIAIVCVFTFGLQIHISTAYATHFYGSPKVIGEPEQPPPEEPCPDPLECCDERGGGTGTAGKPIVLYNGKETYRRTDMVVNGVYSIRIARKYDSQTSYDSPLGYGWSFDHDRRLYEYPDNSVIIRYGCGRRDRYLFAAGTYTSPTGGRLGDLVSNVDGTFTYTYRNGNKDLFDQEGRLTKSYDPQGNWLEYTYLVGRLPLTGTSPYAVDPNTPMTVAYTYRLDTIKEYLADGTLTGNNVTFGYNAGTGRLASITSNDGRQITYLHDVYLTLTRGNLVTVNGLEGIVSTYDYTDANDAHNLTSIQEGAGTTPYINTYDNQDRVDIQTYGNNTIDINYPIEFTQTTVTETIKDDNGLNPYTAVTTYDFSVLGYVDKVTDALKNETVYQRYANGFVEWKQIYQNTGTVAAPVLVLQQQINYTYDTAGNKLTETVTLDSGEIITTTWTYDHNWVASKQTVSSLALTKIFRTEYTFYYDLDGNPTNIQQEKRRKDDGTFQTTTFVYDTYGRLTSTTLPDGVKLINLYEAGSLYVTKTYYEISGVEDPHLTQRFGYDTQGNRNQIWDANSNLTQVTYDDLARVTQITNALNEETHYTYSNENLTQIERGRVGASEGQITQLVYNTENRLITIQRKNDSALFVTFAGFTYDSAGNRLSATDGENRTTDFSYDALNRRVAITDPLSKVTTFDYDAAGNRTSIIDPQLNKTQYTYDDRNQLIKVEQLGVSPSTITGFTYDAVGNLLSVIDPENKTTTYEYDALSRQTKETKSLGQILQYFYDSRNRIDYLLNARLHKIDYLHESWGPVKNIKYYATAAAPNPDRTTTYNYDNQGNLIGASDDSIQAGNLYTISYDALNRPDITTPGYLPGVSKTLATGYDRYGNRSTLTFNDGSALIHSYPRNKLNQITTASLPGGQNFAFTYYNTDELNTVTYPSGVNTTITYQANGPIKDITTNTSLVIQIEQLAYTHDDSLNIDTFTDNDGLHDYGYDGINRLTQALHPAPSGLPTENFAYDNVGNREDTVDATLYDYDQNNRIIKSPGITSYTWDDDGNMLTKSNGTTQTYNRQNRLSTYAKGTTTASYQYDPFGRRIKKTINGTTTWYLWDGNFLLAEYNNTGTRTQRYAYLPNRIAPIQMEDANGTYNVHTDLLDTPIFLTDVAQQVVWRAVYESFGKTTVNNNPDGDANIVTYNIRFPGQYYDQETGLHYNYFRYYSPEIGRYITADPIGQLGDANLYVYVKNNPLYWIDPLGLFRFCTRPLGNLPFRASIYPDSFNLDILHEQGFYDDGTGDNTGFFPDGVSSDDPSNSGRFQCGAEQFDDTIMRQAQQNVDPRFSANNYNLILNNCQDYSDALRNEYDRLQNNPQTTQGTP